MSGRRWTRGDSGEELQLVQEARVGVLQGTFLLCERGDDVGGGMPLTEATGRAHC